jgi:hypothetical protein
MIWHSTPLDSKVVCTSATKIMADWSLADFEAVVHPDARNRGDVDEPPASRGRGPAAFYATASTGHPLCSSGRRTMITTVRRPGRRSR